jgi:hypothetical protein
MYKSMKIIILLPLAFLFLPGEVFGYEVTANSVAFGWTAPGDDGNFGTATAYDIRYSTSNISDANWDAVVQASGEPYPQTAGSAETFTIGSLDPATTYYFAIKSVDEAGNYSTLSNVFSATTSLTLEESDDSVNIVSPASGAILNMTQPTLVVENINQQAGNYYLFEVSLDPDLSEIVVSSGPSDQQGSSETTWQVSEPLVNGTTYYWRVTANDTLFSDILTFTVRLGAFAYPNPFYLASATEVIFTNVPAGKDLIIMTVSGREVRIWANTSGNDIAWNGANDSGNPVASDTYLWFVTETNIKGKIVVIR